MEDMLCAITADVRAEISELWDRKGNFGADLYERGYDVAASKDGEIVIVDKAGDAYPLRGLLQRETTRSICSRMGISDTARLPTVGQMKDLQRGRSLQDGGPMPRRNVGLHFHLDTNRINSRQDLPYMNQLERWRDDDVIILDMSIEAYNEARSGNNTARTSKTDKNIYRRAHDVFGGEEELRNQIGKLLFGDKRLSKAEANDVRILFCARQAGAILVTNDGGSKRQSGGILGHKTELASLGIEVMTDEVAVQKVRKKIAFRDKLACSIARDTGLPLPEWVGQD